MNKIYSNKATWDSATKSTTQSTIAVLTDTNDTVYKGVNVLVDDPKVGDMVFYDSSNKVHFIALDTYVAASKPSGWTAVGVVGHREGSKVAIIYKSFPSKKWADVFRFSVTGMVLDGALHNSTVKLHNVSCGTFSYQATDKQTFASQLNMWLQTNKPSGYQYSAYLQDDIVILQLDSYTAYQDVHTMSGLTVTILTGTEIPANSSAYKLNGVGSEGGIMNLARGIAYFSGDISSTTYNPASDVVSDTTYPVCKPAYLGTSQYQSDHCAWLRAKYGEGEEGWLNYLKSSMLCKYPNMKGVLSSQFADGKVYTALLSRVKYKKPDNSFAAAYPAADYCASIGFNGVEQLSVGDFHLPSMVELMNIIPNITYGLSGVAISNADPINRSLSAIGGSLISVSSHFWSSCRSSSNLSWLYYGSSGFASSGYFYRSLAVVPISLYDLNKR